jgi:hypothetical protein
MSFYIFLCIIAVCIILLGYVEDYLYAQLTQKENEHESKQKE